MHSGARVSASEWATTQAARVRGLLHQRLERLSTFVANSVAAGLDGRTPQCRVPLAVATLTSQARLARLALTTLRQRLAFVQSSALHALQG